MKTYKIEFNAKNIARNLCFVLYEEIVKTTSTQLDSVFDDEIDEDVESAFCIFGF